MATHMLPHFPGYIAEIRAHKNEISQYMENFRHIEPDFINKIYHSLFRFRSHAKRDMLYKQTFIWHLFWHSSLLAERDFSFLSAYPSLEQECSKLASAYGELSQQAFDIFQRMGKLILEVRKVDSYFVDVTEEIPSFAQETQRVCDAFQGPCPTP